MMVPPLLRAAAATHGPDAIAAAESADAAQSLAVCTGIGDAAARLACYDRVSGRQPPAAGVAADAVPIGGADTDSSPPQALRLQVIAAGELPTGRRWFRLDNGETWEQVTARRTTIGTGDEVRLSTSAIGTHHLRRADGSSRSSQVRRSP